MHAQKTPRARTETRKLMIVDGESRTIDDRTLDTLPSLLRAGDLVVLNDAATFPGSIHAYTERGEAIEARLLAELGDRRWRAVLFGTGDWRTPTEHRPPPPRVAIGERIELAGGLEARVVSVSPISPRLIELELAQHGDAFWSALYSFAQPVQYSYLSRAVNTGEMQTAYAARPWAAEPPSAGLGLSWAVLIELMKRGVRIAKLTHAAGLSATGDDTLDAALPLEEKYHLPESTVQAIQLTRATKGRVIAVGTTVVRALEGAAIKGPLAAGEGVTALKIGPGYRRKIVDAILTGVHEPSASHYALLESFVARELLHEASARADAHGYVGHEFGDSWLLWGAQKLIFHSKPGGDVEGFTAPGIPGITTPSFSTESLR